MSELKPLGNPSMAHAGGSDAGGADAVGADAPERLREAYHQIRAQMGRVIIGQDEVLEQMLIALLAGGHCILEGAPGLAKTMMISTLAKCLDLTFRRIQFTPDLMPADITGTEVIQEDRATGTRSFKFLKGPIFAHVVLADEINRTPPKTQAALLEAMQERHVTIGGERHDLPELFYVLATQNPIEQEGTYPLPEAQQDRFMFKILVDYPTHEQEVAIVEATTAGDPPAVQRIMSRSDLVASQRLVRVIPAARDIVEYAVRLARATRPGDEAGVEAARQMLSWGAGPRAAQALILAGKTRAALHGRGFASLEDIRAVALPVLRHRIVLNFSAEAEGLGPDEVIEKILGSVNPLENRATSDARLRRAVAS